ncbi:MAG: D-alanyl-D-alanine carboxypeptidase family protein, partial [Parvularculaceae bacterium]
MTAVWRSVLVSVLFAVIMTGHSAPALANSKYAAIVVHADSGDVLFDRYSNERRYPASLTKMMTLYLLFEEIEAGRLTLTSELAVTAQAAAQPPSKLGLVVGTTIDVETAIKALVVKSANDAAVVVADAIGGSEWRFAQKMTEKARAIGMTRTTFRNASGLPNSKQVTTARDLATLGRRLAQDFPQYFHYFVTDRFSWNGKTYITHNALVRSFPGADGLKTGYTRVSGFNLATSVNRDGDRLIGVVL